MKAISDTLRVARSNLAVQAAPKRTRKRRGRRPQPEAALVTEIKALIAGQPTYGYRRIHALLRRQRREQCGAAVNVKRVYRVMKAHRLLLDRHTGSGEERRHEGRIAVDRPDARWCSDGFEIGCDNGEKVRIAFTLDCCDREAISWVATTGGIDSSDNSRPDGRKRRAPLRAGRQIAPADRVAVGQRLALYRQGNPQPGAIYRLGAVHDTDPKPSIERHG